MTSRPPPRDRLDACVGGVRARRRSEDRDLDLRYRCAAAANGISFESTGLRESDRDLDLRLRLPGDLEYDLRRTGDLEYDLRRPRDRDLDRVLLREYFEPASLCTLEVERRDW